MQFPGNLDEEALTEERKSQWEAAVLPLDAKKLLMALSVRSDKGEQQSICSELVQWNLVIGYISYREPWLPPVHFLLCSCVLHLLERSVVSNRYRRPFFFFFPSLSYS